MNLLNCPYKVDALTGKGQVLCIIITQYRSLDKKEEKQYIRNVLCEPPHACCDECRRKALGGRWHKDLQKENRTS